MTKKGILLVLMHPPPAFEEEFNAWYDTEHIPERLALPGFETGLRFLSLAGGPRYLAIYDLASLAVMDSPDYLRVAHERSSPWTKRVTARARVQRFTGELIHPGQGVTGRAARIGLLRFRDLAPEGVAAAVAGMRQTYEGRPGVSQLRVFAGAGAQGTDVFGVVEAQVPLPETFDPAAFGAAAGALDLVNGYTPF